MHSTNSRTRATHCVILNKDLLLVLKGGEDTGSLSSYIGYRQRLLSRSNMPLDKHEKTAENRIPSQSVALYMQEYRILIHPKGTVTFNMFEDTSAALLEDQRWTQHSLQGASA